MQDIPFLFYIQSNKKIPMYSRDTKPTRPMERCAENLTKILLPIKDSTCYYDPRMHHFLSLFPYPLPDNADMLVY